MIELKEGMWFKSSSELPNIAENDSEYYLRINAPTNLTDNKTIASISMLFENYPVSDPKEESSVMACDYDVLIEAFGDKMFSENLLLDSETAAKKEDIYKTAMHLCSKELTNEESEMVERKQIIFTPGIPIVDLQHNTILYPEMVESHRADRLYAAVVKPSDPRNVGSYSEYHSFFIPSDPKYKKSLDYYKAISVDQFNEAKNNVLADIKQHQEIDSTRVGKYYNVANMDFLHIVTKTGGENNTSTFYDPLAYNGEYVNYSEQGIIIDK